MSEDDNLVIWSQVDKTDTSYTKKVEQRGGFTSIDPTYQAKNATELFGPYGLSWGFSSIDFDYGMVESAGIVIVKAVFFYTLGGKRGEFPINNSWPAKMGSRIDTDFVKKAETNTLGKALSKLGFNADVYMGKFDDAEYLYERQVESHLAKAADEDEAKQEKIKELEADVNKWSSGYQYLPNEQAVTNLNQKHINELNMRAGVLKIDATELASIINNAAQSRYNNLQSKQGKHHV